MSDAAVVKVIEWTPGSWWVVEHRPERGYWPLYEGKGRSSKARREDAKRWLADQHWGGE